MLVLLLCALTTITVRSGAAFSVPNSTKSFGTNSPSCQVLDSTFRPFLREILVITIIAPTIGMATQLDTNSGVLGQHISEFV